MRGHFQHHFPDANGVMDRLLPVLFLAQFDAQRGVKRPKAIHLWSLQHEQREGEFGIKYPR